MKPRLFTLAVLLSAVAGVAAARSVDHPVDEPVPPAAQHDEGPAQQAPHAAPQVAFLGVYASPLGRDEAERLGLPDGTGLVVRGVAPDSQAMAAGLVPGDVLTHLDDQLLVNPEQFTVLIRMHQAGDAVTLHALREGEAIELSAPLGTRELAQPGTVQREAVPLPERMHRQLAQPDGPGNAQQQDPNAIFEQMQQLMQQRDEEMRRMMEQMNLQMQINPEQLRELAPIGGADVAQSIVSMNDGEHIIVLESDGTSRQLKVQTVDGQVIYEGELPADGQVPGLPQEIQDKVDHLLQSNRIELHLRPAAPRQGGPVA